MTIRPLENRKALVTGASSGIGRAIARAISECGAHVALVARREDRLEALVREINEADGHAIAFPADISDHDMAGSSIDAAASALGGLDILINAAGVARQAKLTDGSIQDWKTMLDINVLALAVVTQFALKYFPDSGGHVINLSSMSGHRVPGKGGFYAATKFAVRAMTEGLRQELRERGNLTRVSSISPGFVDTEMLEDYFGTEPGKDGTYEAIGYPILKPEEIADLVLHQLTMPPTAEVTDILVRPTGQKV